MPGVPAVTVVTTAQLKLLFANEKVSVSIYVGARGARCAHGDRGDTAQLKLHFADEKISVSINVGACGARCSHGDRGDHCTIEEAHRFSRGMCAWQ